MPTRKLICEEERICVCVLLVHSCDEHFGDRDARELHDAGGRRQVAAEDIWPRRVDHDGRLLYQDVLDSPARAQGSIRIGGCVVVD